MKNKILNNLKLGLVGLVFAGCLNRCNNPRETTNSYLPQNYANETLEEDLTLKNLRENESLFIFDAKKITGRECKFSISTQEYIKYKQMNHRNNLNNDLTEWVTYNDTTIKSIATKLTKGLKSPEKKAQRLLNFSQSFIYDTSIEKNRDYIRYPLETIVKNNGDCEDLAILAYSLMYNAGLDVQLINLVDSNSSHECIAINGNFKGKYFIRDNKKYFFTESYGRIGESFSMDLSKSLKIMAYTHKEKGVFEVKEIYKKQ